MKVLVADRYPPIQERLVSMISNIPGVEAIGQNGDDEDITASVERLNPALVVMDVCSAVMEDIAKLQQIRFSRQRATVVLLIDGGFIPFTQLLLANGADFIFDRALEFDKLMEVIRWTAERQA